MILINILDYIDNTFKECKYYIPNKYLCYGYFTLGYCNHPYHIKCDGLGQCKGSECEDLEKWDNVTKMDY